ncbi:hypothetical protein OG331_40395 [Streptomyces sp. NBC_01017]|uniref:hypothetical protein n=1 Tax=Streptomyces sp. NBC_01017 TaxID=2903721 RepID=UPI00386332A7|nr:hypothetical protein OG331_40395 [Streptomyces sp. NBC_01017]
MGQVFDAAAEFPTIIFTSALLVALGFWLLVLLGRADVHTFDADAPTLVRTLRGTPFAVAASVVIATVWLVSLTGTLLMVRAGLTGLGGAAARVALLALSTLVAWLLMRSLAVPLARLFPEEPGPRPQGLASSVPFDPGSRRHPHG